MAFLARENRQNNNNDNSNRNFGRGNNNQPDIAQIQKKQTQQQVYKQQLQRQIQQKELKKKQQQQKIKREDQKFMKEIQQIDKKQKQRKGIEKQKQNRILEDLNQLNQSPKQKKQPVENNAIRIVPNGNLNLKIKDEFNPPPQIPKLNFLPFNQYNQNFQIQFEKKRPYLYQENDQVNNYYEQRIRRHKEQMNLKLDQLFHHIHSTKDHIKAQEQIDKIKKKLRLKQIPSPYQFQGESQVQLQYQNKFYHVPKPNREPYRAVNHEKSRMLDYQSSSKFSPYKNLESRAKIRTHHDQFFNLPQREQYQQKKGQKWGTKPGKDNFLANREAIDYQAEKTLGQIEKYLEQLGKQA